MFANALKLKLVFAFTFAISQSILAKLADRNKTFEIVLLDIESLRKSLF